MPVQPERQLLHYCLTEQLGAGGMGEVWLARDTKLDRDVAIKVLPEVMARDKERVLRFEREAKLLAALNHSNIGQIYGFEREGDEKFLVLEYVEGETLAQRLKRGPLAVDEALDLGKQVAEALEAAHEKGIIHRDLKPGNVMVRSDGVVKVLDFGLARAMADDLSSSAAAIANSPTVTVQSPAITGKYTRPGVVLGTAAYMSPEQARGRPLDKRTDIWSFGVMLYECLTGATLFRGESTTDSIGAILHKEPDWSALPADTPHGIRRVLHRCLTKDRGNRLHDVADVRIEIQDVLSGEDSDAGQSHPPRSGISGRTFGLTLAAAVVFGISTVILAWLAAGPEPVATTPVVDLSVVSKSIDPIAPSSLLHGPSVAISPDGLRVAFLGMEHGRTRLFVRELDEMESRALPGTEGAAAPFFSPDGKQIGFLTGGMLKTVAVVGTPPRDVCRVPGVRGACWTERDEIVFAASMDSALFRVPASGGKPKPVTHLDREAGEVNHRFPEALPGGRLVLFVIRREASDSPQPVKYALGVVDLDTGERRIVAQDLQHSRYANGTLLSSQSDGSIAAVRFDPEGSRIIGKPTTVLAGVRTSPLSATSDFAVSRNGTLAYSPGRAGAIPARVVWLDRKGNVAPALPTKRPFTVPRLSNDGRYLLVGLADPNPDLWRYDLKQDPPTRLRLTRDGVSLLPAWSPDDRWICFGSARTGTLQIYRLPTDGSGEAQLLQASQNSQVPSAWSPDGRFIGYMEHHPETGFDVWVKPLDEDSQPWPIANDAFEETEPTFSPDSKWVAYDSTESGTQEVYVKAVTGRGARYPVSSGGGTNAVWRADEIFYRRRDELIVVKVTTEPEFTIGPPTVIFRGLTPALIPARLYDVDTTGERIIATLPDTEAQPPYREIRVVTGWVDKVRRQLSGDESK